LQYTRYRQLHLEVDGEGHDEPRRSRQEVRIAQPLRVGVAPAGALPPVPPPVSVESSCARSLGTWLTDVASKLPSSLRVPLAKIVVPSVMSEAAPPEILFTGAEDATLTF
jgi:hypothetical protein